MFDKEGANAYWVSNDVNLEASYLNWRDNQYDGEPADEHPEFPEIHSRVLVEFSRDVNAGVDTIVIINDGAANE